MCQRVLLAALLCSLAFVAQAGDVYKMVDKTGMAHYSDQPQPGWNRVNITPVAPTQTPEAAAAEAKRAEDCEKKTAELQKYTAAVSIKEKDALGHVHEYSAAERQQLIDSTQKETDSVCTPTS
jgi:hypothetical protein